jgi:orotate phosphoribosyltransferase
MTPDAPPSKAEILRTLRDSGAVKFGSFTLTSGQHSDVYVDVKRVWTHPGHLRRIAAAFAQRLGPDDRLGGMELGAVPLVVATALATDRPYVVVRKAARDHGTGSRIEGEVPAGASFVVLEDVTTTGGSTLETVELLRAAGARVARVLVVVDREAGARERLSGVGVTLEPLATLADLRGAAP